MDKKLTCPACTRAAHFRGNPKLGPMGQDFLLKCISCEIGATYHRDRTWFE